MTEGSLGSARSGVRLTYSDGEAYELFAPVTHRPAFTNARYRVGSLTVVVCVEACMAANFRIVGNEEVIWELSALRFAVQKRVSRRSIGDLLEADFWGVSAISFVRLQTCCTA